MKYVVMTICCLMMTSCISVGTSERLTRIAHEEWKRVGSPKWSHVNIPLVGHHCIGSPGVVGAGKHVGVFVPWPWSEWDFMTRVIMRYELSKVAQQVRANQMNPVIGSIVWAEALLHGPFSELTSWYYVFFPDDLEKE